LWTAGGPRSAGPLPPPCCMESRREIVPLTCRSLTLYCDAHPTLSTCGSRAPPTTSFPARACTDVRRRGPPLGLAATPPSSGDGRDPRVFGLHSWSAIVQP